MAKATKKKLSSTTWLVIIFVVGLMGLFLVEDKSKWWVGALLAAGSGLGLFLKWRKKAAASKPVQQKPQQVASAPSVAEPPASVTAKPATPAPVPLPAQVNGVPKAYQYQHVDVAMDNKLVKDFHVIKAGDTVQFVPEPTNEYDAKAIQLWSNNQLLGYVFRGRMQDMLHDFIENAEPIRGVVASVDPQERKLTYSVAFYRQPRPKVYGNKLGEGRLTASAGVEAQDSILFAEEGEEVEVEYDYEKSRHAFYASGNYIGCLPKKLEQYADTATFVIDEVGETDSGKAFVVVGVYQ